MGYKVYKTLKPRKHLILKQPFLVRVEKSGKLLAKKLAQYVEGLDTIFLDEQRKLVDNPERKNIYFKNSFLTVDESEVMLIKALESHEGNEANGGKIFKEIDIEKEELYEIQELEETDKVLALLAKQTNNMIITLGVLTFGLGYLNKSIGSIKMNLRNKINNSHNDKPKKYSFRDEIKATMNEKNNEIKMMCIISLKEDIINLKKGKDFHWTESGEKIYSVPQNKYAIRDFIEYLSTNEEGQKVLVHLTQAIDKIS